MRVERLVVGKVVMRAATKVIVSAAYLVVTSGRGLERALEIQ